MLEEMIVRYCAPTLAGLKTGGLFCYSSACASGLLAEIDACNRLLNPKGVQVILLRLEKDRALVYVYRPTKLARDINDQETWAFLVSVGYSAQGVEGCIDELAGRLVRSAVFPHEIGLFLGYPLPDVKAFIENKGQNCKCLGCWKVYTDEDRARKVFTQFDKCTRIYCKKYIEEKSILRLTVAA